MTAAKRICLLVVFVTISSKIQSLAVGSTESPFVCPPCDFDLGLTDKQVDQAKVGLDQIQGSFDPFSGVPRVQTTMVSLDDLQKIYVMEKFAVMFSSAPPSMDDGETEEVTRNFQRGKRDDWLFHFRVCPPDGLSYRDLQLGVNATGSPVQIIQLPYMRQWFLEEQCESPFSILSDDIICMEVDRTTTALVINLENPSLGIHLEPIRVQSCATYLLATY